MPKAFDPGGPKSLPRLDASCYQADSAVLWTLAIANRATGWLSDRFHWQWRELLLHAAARDALLCPVYTLMPDHIHLAWIGTGRQSDQRKAMAFVRTHLARYIEPARLQHQPHDRVLTEEERTRNAFAGVCQYILLNPVRAGLAKQPCDWPYSGCVILGYAGATPFDDDYWPWFWNLFYKKREPACDKHVVIRELNGGQSKTSSKTS